MINPPTLFASLLKTSSLATSILGSVLDPSIAPFSATTSPALLPTAPVVVV